MSDDELDTPGLELPVDLDLDTTADARRAAKSQALAAVGTLVRLMRRPGRGAQAQMLAASKLLEIAGVSGVGDAEQRVLAMVIDVGRESLSRGEFAKLVRGIQRATGRDFGAPPPALGDGEQRE